MLRRPFDVPPTNSIASAPTRTIEHDRSRVAVSEVGPVPTELLFNRSYQM